jgi:hypothetical protein
MAKLQALSEKRSNERRRHIIPIEYTYFNKKHYFESVTFNNSPEGMNFRSDLFLQPGSIILIRIKKFHPNGPCRGDCKGLRSLTLAEVRWCQEIVDSNKSYYDVGVKYYPPED